MSRVTNNRTPTCYEFTASNLRHVRSVVHDAADAAGLSDQVADNLVGAVSEIVNNAVLHGGGRGQLTVCPDPAGLWIRVRDRGPGLAHRGPGPAHRGAGDRPPPAAVGGRGLWLARRLSHRMTVSTSATGVTVGLYAAAA